MMVNGEVVLPRDFIANILTKVKDLDENKVKHAIRRAQLGEIDWPETYTDETKKAVLAVEALARASYQKAEEAAEAKKQASIEEEKQKEADKDKWVQAYQATEPSEAIMRPMSELVDQSVAIALGEHFIIKDGDFALKKNADPYDAFGSGFRNLNELYKTSTDIQEGFAVAEARLALAAKKAMGDDWPLALAGASKRDIMRIRKNMYAVSKFQQAGFKVGDVPIGTLRTLTEVSYSDDPARNVSLLKNTVNKFFEKSKEKGSLLNQIEARQLINTTVPERKVRQNWDTFYILHGGEGKSLKVVGSMGLVDSIFDQALLAIDKRNSTVIIKTDGSYSYEAIPTYIGEASEKAVEAQEQPDKVADIVPFPEPAKEESNPKDDLDSLFDEIE